MAIALEDQENEAMIWVFGGCVGMRSSAIMELRSHAKVHQCGRIACMNIITSHVGL